MSRAAILIALSRVLKRQPTPEEYETMRITLLEVCEEGRVYISTKTPRSENLPNEIRALRAQGKTWREVSSELHIPRETARQLVQNSASLLDRAKDTVCSNPT